ncbi:PREDICTED: uncharacterized protein LOC108770530 [Trachymyrmex cornetzi]|uniref:uncharacterized protein LOC108770530 n=1 Tax=Trachymyrmex cornetzi TaxID=471704 RepID=UPI00084F389D|nr:PREDICTED: uncharacterized protein LOC108770530 [Trachymyrmex cornetzi]
MFFYVFSLFNIAMVGLSSAGKTEIPPVTCKRDSNDYYTCLKQSFQERWQLIVKGLPEFDIPPLDPFVHKYESDVKINGTLNAFIRTNGEDHINATAHDVRGTCDVIGHVINDKWIIEHFRVVPSIGKLKVYFDNLFENNKEFSKY